MPDKNFTFEGRNITISCPENIAFNNPFYKELYTRLFQEILDANIYPQIDFDLYLDLTNPFDIYQCAIDNEVRIACKATDTTIVKRTKALLAFLQIFPAFFNFLKNVHADSEVAIQSAEFIHGSSANADNFIEIKKIIDDWNRVRWTRLTSLQERQAGVSILGTISERLLEKALSALIDNQSFFKNTCSEVKSYGDFVLMCLPNNLWISVKSNFARERLLASGFGTDIVGVGFFTDASEFTTRAKIRNYLKVGFLGMYVPDIPISEDQVIDDTNTFLEVERFYEGAENMPLNINGRPFIRKLSSLGTDLQELLAETNLKRRTIIKF